MYMYIFSLLKKISVNSKKKYLCVHIYHVRNNYVTYFVAMWPCFGRLRQFRRLLCIATMSSVATMSNLAQLQVQDGYREAEAM